MDNKVINKQIPLDSIIKVANYLEDYKEKYDKKFELEENKCCIIFYIKIIERLNI